MLDATLGGASANSLGTVEDADAYFENKFARDRWGNLDEEAKEIGLMEATEVFQGLRWWGRPVSVEQALCFPRIHEPASNGSSVPRQILAGCYILALELAEKNARRLAAATSAPSHGAAVVEEMKAAGVARFRLQDYEVSFQAGGAGGSGGLFSLPLAVQSLIGSWVKKGAPIIRGRRDCLYPSLPWALR